MRIDVDEFVRRLARKTAYSSRQQALKMDGAKSITDTIDCSKEHVVGRCSVRVEVPSRVGIDLIEIRILAVVGS